MSSVGSAIRITLFTASLTTVAALAQQPSTVPTGPVPPAILNAKTVFVSNAGADSGLFPEPFSGEPSRGYSEFYSDLKATGQFELVGDPGSADLVLELELTAPNGPTNPNKQNGASDPLPMFRLVIYDTKTHYTLWTLTESVEIAFLQKTHDRNFDNALLVLVDDFAALAGKPIAAPH
jgi:hypothetical protein